MKDAEHYRQLAEGELSNLHHHYILRGYNSDFEDGVKRMRRYLDLGNLDITDIGGSWVKINQWRKINKGCSGRQRSRSHLKLVECS